jgi:hypothetical protein
MLFGNLLFQQVFEFDILALWQFAQRTVNSLIADGRDNDQFA